jgi:hypothetical protein
MFYCRWKPKKICYDPIDYEFIDKINFWVFKEEASPQLDINEIENVLYRVNAIPIVEDSLINNEGSCLVILSTFCIYLKVETVLVNK